MQPSGIGSFRYLALTMYGQRAITLSQFRRRKHPEAPFLVVNPRDFYSSRIWTPTALSSGRMKGKTPSRYSTGMRITPGSNRKVNAYPNEPWGRRVRRVRILALERTCRTKRVYILMKCTEHVNDLRAARKENENVVAFWAARQDWLESAPGRSYLLGRRRKKSENVNKNTSIA